MKQLRTLTVATALIAVVALIVGALPAQATTVSECQALISTLRTATEGTTFGGNHPDRTLNSLLSKLDGATIKLDQGKFTDAYNKLIDYRDAVASLNNGKPKIDPDDAAALIAGADDAIACVQALIDQAATV